jgi:RNA polymerase sigma factor (TIGR02999 family)
VVPNESGTDTSHEITQLLRRWSQGHPEAADSVISKVYDVLREMAARYLGSERRGHTLQATALLHEAYLRLADQRQTQWRDRKHFFAIAAAMMRRILVDHARGRRAAKRGRGVRPVSLHDVAVLGDARDADLVALDEALIELERLAPEQGQVVELSFFGGLTHSEIADLLGVSVPTVGRRWRMARAWLFRYLHAQT